MGLQDPAYPSHSKYQPPLSCSALRGGKSHVDAGGSHARLQRHSGTQPPPAASHTCMCKCSMMQILPNLGTRREVEPRALAAAKGSNQPPPAEVLTMHEQCSRCSILYCQLHKRASIRGRHPRALARAHQQLPNACLTMEVCSAGKGRRNMRL